MRTRSGALERYIAPTGYEGKDGATRMTCDRCQTVMVSKRIGRRHDRIDIYAPAGQEHI